MKTPKTDAASFPYCYGDVTEIVVTEEFAQGLEIEAARWKDIADKLAQRLRSIPKTGAARFPDARDREILKEYEEMSGYE